MRLFLPAIAALLLCAPALARAQDAQSGPDSGAAAALRTRSEPARPSRAGEARKPDEPGANIEATGPVSESRTHEEGDRYEHDCDTHGGDNDAAQGSGQGGEGPRADVRAERARCRKLSDWDIATAPITELKRVTHHSVVVGGRAIAYTATAGTLTIRDDDGKPTASVFYVAYTAGEAGGARRPVTFLYNGGPGSSTLWLHMGSIGPVRVRTDSPQSTRNAPFDLEPNPDSLLDKSDLVFIDAIGAGFSRPLGDTKLQAFWGTDPDIDAFARAIERYLTLNARWNSPKFIFGESYGTTRSAGLSYRLQEDGVQLNGVILLSSILNYGIEDEGFDANLVDYIPSYAAAAAYHHRLASEPADLPAFLKTVRDWARGPYAMALGKASELGADERNAIATQMAAYTGLSPAFILENDLRVGPSEFRKELLRDQRLILGRYDDRFTGIDAQPAGDTPAFDPSDTGITGAFVGAFHDYLARQLGYSSDLSYRPTYYSNGLQWSFRHRAPGFRGRGDATNADVELDLAAAMRENPHLLVYSLNGIYDLATPFFGTEYALAHMQLDPAVRPNLRFAYYPSGHMVYLTADALHLLKTDLARFYDEAAP
jgi:carboxypeptidase C (cathepsin A)